jgi:uncharacterized cofD-like protein
MKTVTVIGGGTGTFIVLSGLKKYPVNLGVIVSMMDSGGSTGRLRDQLGVLPPGDLRQCLVALSDAPLLWRKLFLYRFEGGDLKGHNFGNIFLSALEKVSSNYSEVIDTVSYVLKIKGEVIPVTSEKTHLCVEYENGKVVRGEGNIDENAKETSRIKRAFLDPEVKPNHMAIDQINNSDYIIIGPGDLYTSIIPVLLVDGIKKAISRSKAKVVYILNLMTKSGQTSEYKASDHVEDLKKYLGKEPDYIVVNNGKIPQDILKWYQGHNESPVAFDLTTSNLKSKFIIDNIVDNKQFEKNNADRLTRSILRHCPNKLAKVLSKIIC